MEKELFEIVGIDKKEQQMLVMLNFQDENHIVQDGVVTGVRYWNFNLGIRSGAYGTEHFADYIFHLKKTYESDKKMQELSKERKSQMLLKNGGNFVPPFKLSVFSSKSFLTDSGKDFIALARRFLHLMWEMNGSRLSRFDARSIYKTT